MWPPQEAQRQISSREKPIWADRANAMRIALFGIPEVRRVEQEIRRLKAGAREVNQS